MAPRNPMSDDPDVRLLERYESTGSKSRSILDDPPVFVGGAGACLRDSRGREYVDFLSGSSVANAGHGNPAIAAAIKDQVDTGLVHSGALLATRVKGRLLQRVVEVAHPELTRAHLLVTGGEAVEAALKFARLHSGKPGVIAFSGAYHGRSMGALGLTAAKALRDPYPAQTPYVTHFPYPYPLRNAFGLAPDDHAELVRLTLSLLENALTSPVSALGPTGAVFVEPIQGVGGVVIPPEGFLRGLRELCDRHGLLLVVDEIFCGFGRTGAWFSSMHEDVSPDLMIVSKGLSSSLPVSAVVGREEILGTLPKGVQSTTFEGSPLAMRAAVASIDFLRDIDAPSRALSVGGRVAGWAGNLDSPVIAEVRGRGALWGIEIVDPATGEPSGARSKLIQQRALGEGLICYTGGHHGNIVGIVPPLVITPEQLDTGLDVLTKLLNDERVVGGANA